MNVELLAEHADFLATVDRFCRERVAPRAAEIDRTDEWFPDLLEEAAGLGLQGILIDESGAFDPRRIFVAEATTETMASYSPSVALAIGAARIHTMMLAEFGTDAVKERWLQKVIDAEAFGSMGISEAEAGSDIRNARTVAREEDGEWVLDGGKSWTTLSPISSFTVVLAKVGAVERSSPMAMFLVEREMDGVSYGENDSLISYRGLPMANVYLDDVHVPNTHVMRSEGGFQAIMDGLNFARIEAASLGAGILRGCLRHVAAHANERVAFGAPIAQHQAVQLHVAEISKGLEASRALIEQASRSFAVRDIDPNTCAIAKAFATDAAMDGATRAVSLFGGSGVSVDFEIERYFRDAKATQIFDGTSDILSLRIGRNALARDDW